MRPSISVIIPIYNTKKYILECLDSIIGQNIEKIEIICINDGSTDNVEEKLDKYSQLDSRIKVINQENKGVAASRNLAIDISQGEYLFFVDSDDFLPPNTLEPVYSYAKERKVDVLISKQKIFSDINKEEFVIRGYYDEFLPVKSGEIFCSQDIGGSLFQIFSSELHGKLFNNSFIKTNNIRFPNTSIGEDYFFLYLSLMLSPKITVYDKVTYNYRRLRSDSLTMQSSNVLDFYSSLKFLKDEMIARLLYGIFQNSYEEYIIKQAFLNASRANDEMKKQLFDIFSKHHSHLLNKTDVSPLTPLEGLKEEYHKYKATNE